MKNNQMKNEIQNRLTIYNSKKESKTKLDIHGVISGSFFGIGLRDIKRALYDVKSADELEIHLHSNGGDVFESIAILNYLKNERTETITTYVDGIAASGASVIFMAGDKRIMPKNTQLMIHQPWTYAQGNASDMEQLARQLRQVESSLEECYMDHFVGSNQELKDLLDDETHLTAQQSLDLGFATEIVDKVEKPKPKEKEEKQNKKEAILNKYSGINAEGGQNEIEEKNLVKSFLTNF